LPNYKGMWLFCTGDTNDKDDICPSILKIEGHIQYYDDGGLTYARCEGVLINFLRDCVEYVNHPTIKITPRENIYLLDDDEMAALML